MEKEVSYGTVKQTYCLGDKECTVYGIAVYTDHDVSSVLDAVCGISDDDESVKELARLCNSLELSPIHLRDVTDDFIFAQKSKN